VSNVGDRRYWEMTDVERSRELLRLFKQADEVLASCSIRFHNLLNNGADYCPYNCIKFGLQGMTMIQEDQHNNLERNLERYEKKAAEDAGGQVEIRPVFQ